MYCPSCDKSHGAIHSRCPECHSWLKISSPQTSSVSRLGEASSPARQSELATAGGREYEEAGPPTASSQGWIADNGWSTKRPSEPATSQESGWLSAGGDGSSGWAAPPAKTHGPSHLGAEEFEPQPGRGWLGDPLSANEPSLTQMVGQAFEVESDEFVDDSWVDEEIRDHDFEELEVAAPPPPSPEIAGTFLKLLLAAAMVVLLGGGLMSMDTEKTDPELEAAAEQAEHLQTAQAYISDAEKELGRGKAALAVPQFQTALIHLSEGQAPANKIDELELRLSQAMMAAGDHEESIAHWKNLLKSSDNRISDAAQDGLLEAKKAKRVEANALLTAAKGEVAKEGTHSPRGKARTALELYQDFDGSKAQIADANGVIGLSFLNSQEYGSAETYLQRALAMEPALRNSYQPALDRVRLRKPSYHPQNHRPSPTGRPAPVFDPGTPDYVTTNNRPAPRPNSGGNNSNNGPGFYTAPATERAPMQEIPAHQPQQKPKNDRIGGDGVLNGYESSR